uniref:Hexosyltransferase n=1 Tax=Clastoptera arizonana TaxID=38151 RepID=A0A1B6EB26_9HEMI
MLEKRAYPFIAVVLTATIICLSIWRLSACPGPPYCYYESTSYLLLAADNTSSSFSYPVHLLSPEDEKTLININNFTFLINNHVCNSTTHLFVVIVHSAPQNGQIRNIIRDTWGRDIHIVFFVGETTTDIQHFIDNENLQYHDIVQGSFIDSYRNLTYKHVMALKWVTYHCPGAKYILKADDDVFVNTPLLKDFLTTELSPLGARKLVLCDVLHSPIVKRSYRSKWRVSPAEYKERRYPDYCSGWAIIYSPDVLFHLYKEAQRTSYFWIDDVHLTGTLLSRLNYTHTSIGSLAKFESETLDMINRCVLNEFLFSLLPSNYFHNLWNMIQLHSNTEPKSSSTRSKVWLNNR